MRGASRSIVAMRKRRLRWWRMRIVSMMPLAVSTGVVVIAVAAAVVLVALIAALSMRGRGMRAAERRSEVRRDLDQALERADQAERDRDVARSEVEQTTGRARRRILPHRTRTQPRRPDAAASGAGAES